MRGLVNQEENKKRWIVVGIAGIASLTAAWLMPGCAARGGIALGLTVLAIETLVPLLVAVQVFPRRDW